MALRLGLVGRGRWGRNIERTLASFPDVTLTIVERGAKPDSTLDGVLIATPSATHAAVVLPYIEAGIASFIEKPMATSVVDAERIVTAAERSGATVFIGHIYLYHPAFVKLLELLPPLGPVRRIICESGNDSPRPDSSVLWDWLPHDLAMAFAVLRGEPGSVRAWSLLGGAHAEAAVSEFQFGDATLVSIANWHSHVRVRRVTVVGDRAVVIFDDKADFKLTVHDRDHGISHPPHSNDPPLGCEIRAFLEVVRLGRLGASHIETGMFVARAIAAAERSIKTGGEPAPI